MNKLMQIIREAIEELIHEKSGFNLPSNPERGGLVQTKNTIEPEPDGHPEAEAFFNRRAKERRRKRKKKSSEAEKNG